MDIPNAHISDRPAKEEDDLAGRTSSHSGSVRHSIGRLAVAVSRSHGTRQLLLRRLRRRCSRRLLCLRSQTA